MKRQWIVDFCRELIARDLQDHLADAERHPGRGLRRRGRRPAVPLGLPGLAFAPESGSPEILKAVKKQVDLAHMLDAMRSAVKRGLKLSCFIVIGFPDDTPATLRRTLGLIRRMAVLGVWDVAVSKFVPYPGSALFRRLQREGKIELDDRFFVSPMDFYTAKAPSCADAVSTRRLYWTMLWMFVNFYRDLRSRSGPGGSIRTLSARRLHGNGGQSLRQSGSSTSSTPPPLAEDREARPPDERSAEGAGRSDPRARLQVLCPDRAEAGGRAATAAARALLRRRRGSTRRSPPADPPRSPWARRCGASRRCGPSISACATRSW